jgi:hypothetical protein
MAIDGNEGSIVNLAGLKNLPNTQEIEFYLGSLDFAAKKQFSRLLQLIHIMRPGADHKIVRGYSSQPSRYDGVPMLVFGDIGKDGRARNRCGWIPLQIRDEGSPVTIIFPERARNQALAKAAYTESSEMLAGNVRDWRPLNLEHFLNNSKDYFNEEWLNNLLF